MLWEVLQRYKCVLVIGYNTVVIHVGYFGILVQIQLEVTCKCLKFRIAGLDDTSSEGIHTTFLDHIVELVHSVVEYRCLYHVPILVYSRHTE